MATPETQDGAQKDFENWTTGDEPATDPQKSYLTTLAQDAGKKDLDIDGLSKAEAGKLIEELQGETNRGQGTTSAGGQS